MRRTTFAVIALTTLLPTNGWATNITVEPGDTLSKISLRHNVPIKEIMRLNGLDNSNEIKAGSKLKLNDQNKHLKIPLNSIHKVATGETIGKISKLYKINKADIIALNNLHHPDHLYPGQSLRLPQKSQAVSIKKYQLHKVARGENLGKISKLYKINKADIIALNNLHHPDHLYPGQFLKVPTISSEQNAKYKHKKSLEGLAKKHITMTRGQTLSRISQTYGVPLKTIIQINKIKDPNNIKVGTKLYLDKTAINSLKESPYKNGTTKSKKSEWRTYGPLQVDWSHWNLIAGSYVAPSLNNKGKPLYLAVNCSVKKINSTGENGVWKDWNNPVKSFEKNLVIDLCKTKKS